MAAELFPTSYRSTAGSVLAVTGTTGGALGFFLEGVLYRTTGSHWIAIRYLTLVWLAVPIIMMLFFPETAGLELEAISPEKTRVTTSERGMRDLDGRDLSPLGN